MLLEYFKQYIKVTRGVSDSSVGHYVTGINSINALLSKYNYPIKNVFHINSVEELQEISEFLKNNKEFCKKDSVGHHMYSVAFNHFYRFVCEDRAFFERDISCMDIKLNRPEIVSTTTSTWKRNHILINHSIEAAHYLCEHDATHNTFKAKSTGKQYMEGHHLIPLKFQKDFNCSIDIYANIVSLCPVCHRLLHHGVYNEKIYVIEKLFDIRQERLYKSGIDISKADFIKLAR